MSEIVYAVHTRACTYLLDEDGFCKWVLSRSGERSDDRCVGAQFVAALDLRSKGGLVGELRIGAQALFIRHENGRFALIRTKPIEHVEIRGGEGELTGEQDGAGHAFEHEEEPEPVVLPDQLAVAAVFNTPPPAPEPPPPSARVILQPPPPPRAELSLPTPRPPPIAAPLPMPVMPPRAYVPPPPAPRPPPVASPRPSQPRHDPTQETQPLPPAGPVPAWPPMLAPPPPQAELMPLGPARPLLPSAEELDVSDLEEVADEDQIYSMEVTLTLPLFRADTHGAPAGARHPSGDARPRSPHHLRRR